MNRLRKLKTNKICLEKLKDKNWYPCVHCGGEHTYEVYEGPGCGDYFDKTCVHCKDGSWTKERFALWYEEEKVKIRKSEKIKKRRELLVSKFQEWVVENRLTLNALSNLEYDIGDRIFGNKTYKEFRKTLRFIPQEKE